MVVPHSTRTAPARAPARLTAEGCLLRGDWGAVHSLAIVNEKLADALDARGLAVERLRKLDGPSDSQAVGIAAHWPPRFEAPSRGPFVMYQPWEFGVVPASWVDPIRRRVDEVWTPSDYARQAYIAAGVAPELVHVVPNGVDVSMFRRGDRALARRRLGIAEGVVFAAVGRLNREKGFDVALEAIARVAPDRPDVRLLIVGDGEERAALERLTSRLGVADRVEFAGVQPQERVAEYLVASDVFLFPTRRDEAGPLVLPQAMACGLPSVASMAGGIPEVLEPADGSRAGLLVRPGSVEELEAAIRVLSADPTLRGSLGDAAHDRAVSEYSLERMIARTVAVYRIALARAGKTR